MKESKPESTDAKMRKLEAEVKAATESIELLHETLEGRGINSRRVADIFGRTFAQPVDQQHKSKAISISSCANPHMRAFHASWFGFFSTFFSTFAPAPLAPVLKKKETLGLTREELQYGNLASVTANIVCRFLMGIVCDKMGARKGLAFVLLVCVAGIVPMMFVQSAAGFITCRGIIGVGLASFVACQVWCTQQFAGSIVGAANATTGGWGNVGGGVTNLLMPFIYLGFMSATSDDEDRSWRLCFIAPLVLHLLAAALTMSGRDLPDGNFAELEISGAKQKSDSGVVAKVGVTNVNAWLLTIIYALSFGVELTITNIASQYFYEYHGMTTVQSGLIASSFGLMNIFARSLGGITSDLAFKKFGIRGRIWGLWIFQMLEGVLCLILGLITIGYDAPTFDSDAAQITGYTRIDNEWVPFNGTGINTTIEHCGTDEVTITNAMRPFLDPRFQDSDKVVLSEPPWGAGADCISNSSTLGVIIICFILFSVAVQMAEGLCFGIVPYVSRPALGVVSGMVGAGGNAGSLITNAAFFTAAGTRTDSGFISMGIMILIVTCLLVFVYFPESGGMFLKAHAINYDPQRIKPPEGYRGADSMDFANVQIPGQEVTASKEAPDVSDATPDSTTSQQKV